jgi:hypothetical protein
MATHTTDGLGAEDSGHGADTGTHTFSKEELAKLRLRRINAYVHDGKAQGSKAAKDKAAQRKKNNKKQCNVEVVSEEVRKTIRSLAAAIKADHSLHAVISSFASDGEMRKTVQAVAAAVETDHSMHARLASFLSNATVLELCKILSAPAADISSIVELARRGNLTLIAGICVANPMMLDVLESLAPSGVDVPLAETARREDLLKLLSAVAANPKLARCLFLLATAEDELLETISNIISRVQEIKAQGGEAAALLDTATAALCHPVENLRLMRLLKGNGFRARALRWILRFER